MKDCTYSPLVATLVHSNSQALSENWLIAYMTSVLYGAYSDVNNQSDLPEDFLKPSSKISMFVEGPLGITERGNMTIHRMSLEALMDLIAVRELLPEVDEGTEDRSDAGGPPVYMFGIGSREFCAAFIHYLATGTQGGGQNWAFHFIRGLSAVRETEVLWMLSDSNVYTGPPSLIVGDIREMFLHAKEAVIAA